MKQIKTARPVLPVDQQLEPEVFCLRAQFDQNSPMDELVRDNSSDPEHRVTFRPNNALA
jgi:hypothetical protein